MNEKKISWAPVYDAANRSVEAISIDELENVGVPFNSYGITDGDVLVFDANPEIAKQAPRKEGQASTYLVACTRNGNKSWVNPNFFLRVNANLDPIYPDWAALGSAKIVVEKLIALKTLKTTKGKTISVPMTQFNRDGSFKEQPKRDEAGNIVLTDEGIPEMVRVVDDRPFPVLPSPEGK